MDSPSLGKSLNARWVRKECVNSFLTRTKRRENKYTIRNPYQPAISSAGSCSHPSHEYFPDESRHCSQDTLSRLRQPFPRLSQNSMHYPTLISPSILRIIVKRLEPLLRKSIPSSRIHTTYQNKQGDSYREPFGSPRTSNRNVNSYGKGSIFLLCISRRFNSYRSYFCGRGIQRLWSSRKTADLPLRGAVITQNVENPHHRVSLHGLFGDIGGIRANLIFGDVGPNCGIPFFCKYLSFPFLHD